MKKTLRIKSVGWFTTLSIMASFVLANFAMAYEKEINAISVKMAENIAKSGKKRIAVVDFTDLQGNVTELGRFIAEEFSVALLSTGQGFEVLDRTHLQSLLKEHKLSATGLIDPQTARQLGKIAGVDALITGTLTPFGESVRLSAKILDAETAKIIGANTGDIPKTKAIEELLGKGINGEETRLSENKITTSLPKSQQTVDTQGFTFQVDSCKRSGNSVICFVLITSNEQDRTITINPNHEYIANPIPCKIFDNFGNEYISKRVRIANKEAEQPIETQLVANIPTKTSIYFENISQEATQISLLEVGGTIKEVFRVQFRNIPFSK